MKHTKKVILIASPLLILLVVGISLVALVYFRVIKNPFQNISFLQKESKVSIKKEYKNPFEKQTQYVNPFETYKNPFVVVK